MGGSEDLTCQGGPEGPVQRDSIYSWVRNIKIKHALAHKSQEEVHIRELIKETDALTTMCVGLPLPVN